MLFAVKPITPKASFRPLACQRLIPARPKQPCSLGALRAWVSKLVFDYTTSPVRVFSKHNLGRAPPWMVVSATGARGITAA
jgi:hypothetical protein